MGPHDGGKALSEPFFIVLHRILDNLLTTVFYSGADIRVAYFPWAQSLEYFQKPDFILFSTVNLPEE